MPPIGDLISRTVFAGCDGAGGAEELGLGGAAAEWAGEYATGGRKAGGIADPLRSRIRWSPSFRSTSARSWSVISFRRYSTVRTSNGRGASRFSSATAEPPRRNPGEPRGEPLVYWGEGRLGTVS